MHISQSLMKLLTTGKCQKQDREDMEDLNDIDITTSLYYAGALTGSLDYNEYILNKFNGELVLEGLSLNRSSFRMLQLERISLTRCSSF
jgi:hypothetical protein